MPARKLYRTMLVLAAAFSAFGGQGESRYALLVGANSGGPGLDRLRYAEADAERFAEVLKTIGEFPQSQVKVLRQPDSAGLARELAALKKSAASARGGNSMVLFYYSGHSDGESLLLGRGRYPLREVKGFLDSSGAALRVGVFDACQSGSVAALKGGKAAEPFYFSRGGNTSGQVIIASSSARQASQESEVLRGGVFTHHWLNGLRGSADPSGSRYVTLHDAYRYAYRKTVESSALTGGGVQYPSYNFNIQGDGDIRLTNLNKTNEGFVFDKSCEGSFIIYGGRGAGIAADFSKQKGTEVFIAAPSGRYRIINTRAGDVMTLDIAVNPGAAERITDGRFDNRVAAMQMRPKGAAKPFENVRRTGFGIGGAAGIAASYPLEEDARPMLALAGAYNIQPDLQMFANARILPGRYLSADLGINLFWEADDYKVYVGAGPAMTYDYRSKSLSGDKRISYAVRTQIGFSAIKNEKVDIQALLPIILSVSGDNSVKTGLEIMFLYWR